MMACSYYPVNLPLGRLGVSTFKDFSFQLPVPNALLFAAGGYCVMSMYRYMRMAWSSAMVWFSSWFNAN